MTRKFRVYTALPTSRDLRDPKTAKALADKAPLNWVWVAFVSRASKKGDVST